MNPYDNRKIRVARIESMLKEKPMTKSAVVEATGYSRASVWKCFDELIFRHRIFVADWEKSRKGYIEMFGFGSLPDVPKPILGDEEDDEIEIKRPRVEVVVRRDPLDIALFGEYRAAA